MRSESSSFHLFFTALALSDLSLIYVGLVPVWVEYQFHYSLQNIHQVCCKVINFLFYFFGALSAWLLAGMTIQRAISVVWPHKVRSSCTKRQSCIIIAAMVVTIALIQSYLIFVFEIHPLLGNCFFKDSFIDSYLDVWLWLDALLQSLLPFCVLLLSNSVLVWSVVSSLRRTRGTLAGGTGAEQVTAREKKLSSMTVTLIAVSAAFILLTGPIAFNGLINFYLGFLSADFHSQHPHMSFLTALANLLWYTNSSINFLLYILTGSRFREELRTMLGLVKKPGPNVTRGTASVNTASPAAAAVRVGNGREQFRGIAESPDPRSSERF